MPGSLLEAKNAVVSDVFCRLRGGSYRTATAHDRCSKSAAADCSGVRRGSSDLPGPLRGCLKKGQNKQGL